MKDIAAEKAPGPDGFIGVYYKASWEIIKEDVLAAINFFFSRHDQHFNLLNTAHIVLLPKKEDASRVGDFRPISLSHSVTKLISKLLANRLSSDLDKMISRAQSAFIKKRSIQDNFLYTQNLIRELHRTKRPTLFLKLDIAKAFDTVRVGTPSHTHTQHPLTCRWRKKMRGRRRTQEEHTKWSCFCLVSCNCSPFFIDTLGQGENLQDMDL